MRFYQIAVVFAIVCAFTFGAQAQMGVPSDTLKAIAISPDGKLLASGSTSKVVTVWDFETGALLHTLQGHTEAVNSVNFSADSKLLASGADDVLAKVWDVATGENLHTLTGHVHRVMSVEFSADGSFLASGSAGGQVKVWDATTFAELRSFSGHGGLGLINAIDVSPNSKYIASSATEPNIIIWDPTTGEQVDNYKAVFFGDSSSDDAIANLAAQLAKALPSVFAVQFSADSRFVLSYGNDGNQNAYEIATKDMKKFGIPSAVDAMAFSDDGRFYVAGLRAEDSANIILMDFEKKTSRSLKAHRPGVKSVVFHPDNKRFVTGGIDGAFKIWDAVEGKVVGAIGSNVSLDFPLYSDMPGVVLGENFDDNALEWNIDDDADDYHSVQQGVYLLKYTDEEAGTYVWNDCVLDQNKDFRLEAKISHPAGVDDSGYGLLWGLKDINNTFGFEITANGHFRIFRETDEGMAELVDWTENDAIVEGNEINDLAIQKMGGQLTFYINNVQVHQMPFQPFFGDQIGFSLWSNQLILIDYVYAIQGGE